MMRFQAASIYNKSKIGNYYQIFVMQICKCVNIFHILTYNIGKLVILKIIVII